MNIKRRKRKKMKVILTENVESIGQAGDLVEVKKGYFRNFLEPRQLALRATRENLDNWEEDQKRRAEIKAENEALARELKEQLESINLVITSKAGEEGKLFGSVTNQDIARVLNESNDLNIDRKKIEMEDNIKELGNYIVKVRVYPEMTADLKVEVKEEE